MTKITINKSYFHFLLHRKYGKYIKDANPCHQRYLRMLAGECNVSLRTIYNFQSNTYSLILMKTIIQALNITRDEYHKLIEIKQED